MSQHSFELEQANMVSSCHLSPCKAGEPRHMIGQEAKYRAYLGLVRFQDFKAHFKFHFKRSNFRNFEILKFHFDIPKEYLPCKLTKQTRECVWLLSEGTGLW